MKKTFCDISTIKDIEKLVTSFYKQALADEHIGMFFSEAVPIQLDEHLPRIVKFWSSILLYTNEYKDNPMLKHIVLNHKMKVQKSHMEQWLSLWNGTIDTLYSGPMADLAKSRAEQIGILMLRKIRYSEQL